MRPQRTSPSPERVGSTAHGSAGSAPPARPEMVGRPKPGTSVPSTHIKAWKVPCLGVVCDGWTSVDPTPSSPSPPATANSKALVDRRHRTERRGDGKLRILFIRSHGPRRSDILDLSPDSGWRHHHQHQSVYYTIGPPVPSNPPRRTKYLISTKRRQSSDESKPHHTVQSGEHHSPESPESRTPFPKTNGSYLWNHMLTCPPTTSAS